MNWAASCFGTPLSTTMSATSNSRLPEAVRAANAVDYGLAAYVYGEDLAHALAVAEQLQAGGVGVNVNDVSELQAPFGGWKQSGIGRELGPEGLHAYLQTKHTKVRRPTLHGAAS